MSLLSRLNDDLKLAMKAKEKTVLQVIRMIKASLQNEQIKLGRELTADEELTLLSREMKQRRDSLAEFEKANRDDLYLPAYLLQIISNQPTITAIITLSNPNTYSRRTIIAIISVSKC